METKTQNLTGAALDWAVAECAGGQGGYYRQLPYYQPSTDWSQGGPIIEREGIDIYQSGVWVAEIGGEHTIEGPTPLIAAMRCFVMARLGNEIDIPEELK